MITKMIKPINPRINKPIPQIILVCLNSCLVGLRAILKILAQEPRLTRRNWASMRSWAAWTLSSKVFLSSPSSDMVSPRGANATYHSHLTHLMRHSTLLDVFIAGLACLICGSVITKSRSVLINQYLT